MLEKRIVFTSVGEIYEFEIIKKNPNVDTQSYFDAFVATEEYFKMARQLYRNTQGEG